MLDSLYIFAVEATTIIKSHFGVDFNFQKVILAVPGAENQVLCYKRLQATTLTQEYLDEKDRVEKELRLVRTSNLLSAEIETEKYH